MDDEQIFAGCARLRRGDADWLETLTPEQLDAPSLCEAWTVREVAGHLAANLTVKPRRLLAEVVRQGFRPNRANTALARRAAAVPIDQLVATLREHAEHRAKVPVIGARGPLIDLLVHGGDMRLPLGVPMPAEPELTITVLDHLADGSPGMVPRRRLEGLQLVATDANRTWRTAGAAVEGTLNDLLMAVSGRPFVLDRLSGPGAPTLAARLSG